MRCSRRTLIAASLLAVPALSKQARLRFLHLRHAALVVELGSFRLLFNPSFARDLLPMVKSKPASVAPGQLGHIDMVFISSARADHFSTKGIAHLASDKTFCFVPDTSVQKRLRHLGFRRVRVVRPGDVFHIRSVRIEVTAASDALFSMASVGYHVSAFGRSFWHTGPIIPLVLDDEPLSFARERRSELVFAPRKSQRVFGRILFCSTADARALATFAKARYLIGIYDGIESPWFQALEEEELDATVSMTEIEPGRWTRITP